MSHEQITDPQGPKSCAVCAQPLLRYQDGATGEITYMHPLSVSDDHPVVPVEVDEVATRHKCDFCSAPSPSWVLDSDFSGMDVVGPDRTVGLNSGDSGWATCDDCRSDIERNSWNAIERRSVARLREEHGLDDETVAGIVPIMRAVHRGVRKGRKSGFRPIR